MHRSINEPVRAAEIPLIQFDYFFLGDEGDEKLVAMAGVDRASGSIFATQSIVKGQRLCLHGSLDLLVAS